MRKADFIRSRLPENQRAALGPYVDLNSQPAKMNDIDLRLNRVKVPKGYLSQLNTLREHADDVRKLLHTRVASPPTA
ncbi:MAG TPA: hypothetical protein VLN25_00705 [Burkholderiaceae bacterium]|nr:hypothetical protein [Burkholderiaceae bacterium]